MNFNQGIMQAAKLSYPKTTFIISLIGLVIVFRKFLRILNCIYGLVRKRKNLIKRYGSKSWVFITGSSDGIGKALAISLAKIGFNIILSARTQSKLQKVRQLIKQKHPQIQVKIVVADYKRAHEQQYLNNILSQIQNLDISIVINNVGVDVLNYYHQLSPKQIADLIKINCFPVSLINRFFIPILLQRKKRTGLRSAIVNVASIAGMIPMPLHNIYSASKAYVDRLSIALQYQYPQLDIISLRPSQVSTPMTFNKDTDIFTITAQQCAQGFLDNLGYENMTYGHWRHKLQGWLYDNVPEKFFNYVFLNYVGPDFMNDRKKAMKKQ